MPPIPTYLKAKDQHGQPAVIVNPLKDYVRPFWLSTDEPNENLAVPASGSSAPTNLTVTAEGHFEGAYFTSFRSDPMTILMNYPGKRMNLMNREIHLDTIAQLGETPFILPETLWVPAIRSINVTFRNLTANPATVRFVCHGRRWYHYEAPQDLALKIQAPGLGEDML